MKQIQPFQKHWLQVTSIVVCRLKPPKAACQFAADDILLYKFCYISNGLTSPFGKKEKKNCHLYNTILSLYISYQDITRRVCWEVKYTMDMKNYLRTQITLYEEDKNYPIWRRQERRSKYAVQLASWQLRSNSPKMSVRPSVCLSHLFTPQPLRAPGYCSTPSGRVGGRQGRQAPLTLSCP